MAPQVPSVEELAAIFALEGVRGFGPQKFKELHQVNRTPQDAIAEPELLPTSGKRGAKLRAGIADLDRPDLDGARERAEKELKLAEKLDTAILTYNDAHYPASVYQSNNPVPLLWIRGDAGQLGTKVVACVGSRQIREPYSDALRRCAAEMPSHGWAHVSGFATGADAFGHVACHDAGGVTVAVMPSGLAVPFPPENRGLWDKFLESERAVFVSEFPLNRRAAALTLRKRNKLIVALAAGVLVAQSSEKGGAMNAYRFAIEQKKPVATFVSDGADDTSGNAAIASEGRHLWATFDPFQPTEPFARWLSMLL